MSNSEIKDIYVQQFNSPQSDEGLRLDYGAQSKSPNARDFLDTNRVED